MGFAFFSAAGALVSAARAGEAAPSVDRHLHEECDLLLVLLLIGIGGFDPRLSEEGDCQDHKTMRNNKETLEFRESRDTCHTTLKRAQTAWQIALQISRMTFSNLSVFHQPAQVCALKTQKISGPSRSSGTFAPT